MRGRSAPESVSRQVGVVDRDHATVVVTYVVLVGVTVIAWAQVVSSALTPDPMQGMYMPPTILDGLTYVTSWTVMMAAMMLPSALPMIGLYAATQRRVDAPRRILPVGLFTLVYLGVWAATGVPMYFASTLLARSQGTALGYGIAAVLVVAGTFQVSPLKQMCLRHCRSPIGFFLGHWRAGWRGSLAMGWAHAIYCIGCCWALMVVLVVAGAMGLGWVLLISAAIAAEKLLPGGRWIARGVGVALVLLGVFVALRPDVAAMLRSGGHSM